MLSRGTWEVEGNTLFLRLENGAEYIPRAQEIYSIIFEGVSSIHGISPINELTGLQGIDKFSRFPLELVIELRTRGEHGDLILEISAEDGEISVSLDDFFDRRADHLILNQVWFPILRDALEDLRAWLIDHGIAAMGGITLKQYLQLQGISDYPVRDAASGTVQAKDFAKALPRAQRSPIFAGTLYPYQEDGHAWLSYVDRQNLGCILADEMGLGKTIQVIALLAGHAGSGRPSLIVAPATLLTNWMVEIEKFAPELSRVVHHGMQRTGFPDELRPYDVVITSYETVVRDEYLLRMIDWSLIVLDEAQAIRNPRAQRTNAVKAIPRRSAIAMSGTPVQNRLVDLWSIVDFAIPGLLGPLGEFEDRYSMDRESAKLLEPLVSPIILRRRVGEVARDLPDKIRIPQPLVMDPIASEEYEAIRQQTIEEYGNRATLVALTRLRMYCAHPSLILENLGDPTENSAKYRRVLEILDEVFENDERALVFTTWQKMIDILVADIARRFGVSTNLIDGRVAINDRQSIVDAFNAMENPGILVLNPIAGGTGLNITGANHVIHYNLEWNPAVIDQATARAHRLGQRRPVTEHRLYYVETVEEVINQRLRLKEEVAGDAIVGVKGRDEDYADILEALKRSPSRRSKL